MSLLWTRVLVTSRHGHVSCLYQHLSHSSYGTSAASTQEQDAKPFESMPGPRCLPIIGTMHTLPRTLRQKNTNEVMAMYNKKYGPIIREQFGPRLSDSLVSIFDAEALETLHRHDGKYPRRLIMEAWQNWRDESQYSRGILIEDGSNWKRMRVLLDKQMLRPRHVSSYAEDFTKVSSDFVDRLRKLRGVDTKIVDNISRELFYWSLESIGTVLYETRFGGLSTDTRDPEMAHFIQSVHNMFISTSYVFYLPRRINKKILPKWQTMHDNAWAGIFKQGKKQIDLKCVEIEKQIAEGKEVSGFLSTLIVSKTLSMDDIYANISELMAAAVDTTSNVMLWVIYELSQRRDIQATLRDEILSQAPRGSIPTVDQLQKMPYLKGFIREILRLYPVANVDTRIANEDLVLCGYHVPKDTRILGSMFVLGRNPDYYPDPLDIKPERWIRKSWDQNQHPFAWLSFGYGTRMCIGRRVAELEMYILTSMLLQEFDIRATDDQVNHPSTAPLIVPERPVLVQFVDR